MIEMIVGSGLAAAVPVIAKLVLAKSEKDIEDKLEEIECMVELDEEGGAPEPNDPRGPSGYSLDIVTLEPSGAAPEEKRSADMKIVPLIENYHKQALSQASILFWFSLGASIFGFIFILIMLFSNTTEIWYEYIVKSTPGIVMETISVLFFKQARETRERATDFFAKLNYEKQIDKSIAIANTIEDMNVKSNIKAQIALQIIGSSLSANSPGADDKNQVPSPAP